MRPFDLRDFLARTGFSLPRLAAYLQVAPGYLESAAAGEGQLTTRDQAKCRLLWRRLFRGKQLELPFAESLGTFTRGYARAVARAAQASPSRRRRPPRPAGTAAGRIPRRRRPRRAAGGVARGQAEA